MMFKRDTNLQAMCLSVVAYKMDIFSLPCPAIQLFIEFLRRCYSDNLYELINKVWRSNEKYLVWLMSPHWKNVFLNGTRYKYSAIVFKMQSVGDSITSLSLKDSGCSHQMLSAIICCLPNLVSLNLSGTTIQDDILQLIRRMCPSLHTLDLSNCSSLTDKGLRGLCTFNFDRHSDYPSLKVLNLSDTNLSSQDISFVLDYLTSLEVLEHWYLQSVIYHLHSVQERKVVKKILNLTYCELFITQEPFEGALNAELESYSKVCPFTNNIFIRNTISEDTFQQLAQFECLKKLKLFNMVCLLSQAPSTSPFLTIKGAVLTHLEISRLSVSADVIANTCPNLEKLLLWRVKFEDFKSTVANGRVPALKYLKELFCQTIALDEDLSFKSITLLIRSSENLRELSIQYSENFTDAMADVILKLPNLLAVDFSFTDIKPETLLRFFLQPDITKICIDGCPSISLDDKTSCISKLINNTPFGNTLSWVIDYSEQVKKTHIMPSGSALHFHRY